VPAKTHKMTGTEACPTFLHFLWGYMDDQVRITLSVLDRLIDHEPEVRQEPPSSRAKGLRQMKQAVLRDLEWLLNTRRFADELSPDWKELNMSVAAYGLPDFTHAGVKSPADKNRLRRAIESIIIAFEPRLENVTVILEPSEDANRVLKFRIDGRLKVDPAPEPVTFDSTMQIGRGEYTLKEK